MTATRPVSARVEPLLDRGIVPTEFTGTCLTTLADLCAYYQAQATHSKSDEDVLRPLQDALQGVAMARLTYSWVEGWVEAMKASLKPSTLTKRVGLLTRVVDWGMRRELINLSNNPLRLLPKGYATSGVDRNLRYSGERDRRLQPGEEEAIRKVLKGKEEGMLFDLALETAMRLSEMLTLTTQQVDLGRRTIFLEKTKNGSKRQVPMSSVLHRLLGEFLGSLEPDSPHIFSWGTSLWIRLGTGCLTSSLLALNGQGAQTYVSTTFAGKPPAASSSAPP